jgi:hypothetical protein
MTPEKSFQPGWRRPAVGLAFAGVTGIGGLLCFGSAMLPGHGLLPHGSAGNEVVAAPHRVTIDDIVPVSDLFGVDVPNIVSSVPFTPMPTTPGQPNANPTGPATPSNVTPTTPGTITPTTPGGSTSSPDVPTSPATPTLPGVPATPGTPTLPGVPAIPGVVIPTKPVETIVDNTTKTVTSAVTGVTSSVSKTTDTATQTVTGAVSGLTGGAAAPVPVATSVPTPVTQVVTTPLPSPSLTSKVITVVGGLLGH